MTLPFPIDGHKKVLDEETFRRVYLDSEFTIAQVAENYKEISLHCMTSSVKYYKVILPEEVKKKAHKNYSKSAYRRIPGIHVRKPVKVSREVLVSLIAEGKTEWAIANELGIAPQTIRKNVREYGLLRPSQRIYNLSDSDWENLEWANQLSPGLMESAYRGIDNPHEFYHKLYDAFVGLCKILWTIQRIGGRYTHYQEHKKIVRDHISWRINKQEILLSEELRKQDIFHVRGFYWAKSLNKGFNADIYIPSANLLVEINGNVHSIGFVIDRDEEKEKLVKQLGYKRLMFLSGEIDKELDVVVEKIKKEMK